MSGRGRPRLLDAGLNYLIWGAQERQHADYCLTTGRVNWQCWNYFGRASLNDRAADALDAV